MVMTPMTGALEPRLLHRMAYRTLVSRALRARPSKLRIEPVAATIDRIRRADARLPYLPMI
jgi:hypothetical protein